MAGLKVKLLLDSGAFSAWNRGTTLDLKDYIRYLKDHEKLIWAYVSMDVIPGKFGEARTTREIQESAKGSYRNHQIMKDAGLSPVPVFHQGEPLSTLEQMLKDGETYIGISSAKDLWTAGQRAWLDQIFTLLTDSKGRPLIKTHGFGITRPNFLFRYPFYTTDSTSWSLAAGFGKIFVPVYTGGKLVTINGRTEYVGGQADYLEPPLFATMSGVMQKSGTAMKRQFEGLVPAHQELIRRFLKDEVGLDASQIRHGTTNRRRAILVYYKHLQEQLYDRRFRHRGDMGLLQDELSWNPDDPAMVEAMGLKPHRPWHLRLMFATSLSKEWASLMNELDCNNRLLSYFELKDRPLSVLEEYVTTGSYGKYKKKTPKVSWGSEAYRNYRRLKMVERVNAAKRTTEQT